MEAWHDSSSSQATLVRAAPNIQRLHDVYFGTVGGSGGARTAAPSLSTGYMAPSLELLRHPLLLSAFVHGMQGMQSIEVREYAYVCQATRRFHEDVHYVLCCSPR